MLQTKINTLYKVKMFGRFPISVITEKLFVLLSNNPLFMTHRINNNINKNRSDI